jgi:predicted ATPase
MLKKLILENWKSFRYAELPIDPLTVLIGTNASGKSNAIEALEFLNRISYGGDIQDALLGNADFSPIRGGADGVALKNQSDFTLSILTQGEDEYTDYLYSITISTKPEVRLLAESLTKIKQGTDPKETPKSINIFISERNVTTHNLSDLSIYVKFNNDEFKSNNGSNSPNLNFGSDGSSSFLDLLHWVINSAKEKAGIEEFFQTLLDIFILDPVPSKMRSYSRFSKELTRDAANIAGVLAALPEEKKRLIESTLSSYATHLPERDIQRVWAEPVGRLGSDAMLYCEESWVPGQAPIVVDATSMSDGTLRFLAIVTALLTRPEGSQLVIEEVDNGLHPSRAELLLKMLRELGEKRKIDVLVTTHNPALLNALGLKMVPFVVVAHRDVQTGESKLTPLDDVQHLPKLLASGSVGDLATQGTLEKVLSHSDEA